ncbi:MAG: FAD-binding protein [Alphaproteobacteria bacterium]|nr:FAD-binding protein [Alphaproteobacteria bacterium]MBV9418980.1 FAD-binding protein [Alphaproteobacteria bacterium]MBV9542566.1 FAD-binding protein [Alphaproteobacteria bacterium]MBV9904501.1 FAD-binding protein [Alphaproteobacteria bacterium]
MPAPDSDIVAHAADIAAALRALLPDGVVSDAAGLAAFDGDALTAYRQKPLVTVLPRNADEVAAILSYASAHGVPIVPRGAGTSLSGGALPRADGILIAMTRMNRIIEVDLENRCVVTQPGVTNLNITRAVEAHGFYYGPDPSSQIACTIGGNVAENSGGLHCLKYGLTTNNLLGAEMVLVDGTKLRLGGKAPGAGGLDLLGVVAGSEGLLGVVTEATLRILPKPPMTRTLLAAFGSVPAAGQCVADIIAAGIVPAAMEFMDRRCIEAVEAHSAPGYPKNVEGVLIIDADGLTAEVDHAIAVIGDLARKNGAEVREASDEAERARLWAGRKAAFPAMGRLAPDMLCMDGTIPRRALPQVLARMAQMAEEYRLGFCNVFHAGDGNLHPLIIFDVMKPGELERAEAFGAAILRLCVEVGGVLTGEHGVGVEKRDLMPDMFSPADLEQQGRIKCAFDGAGLLNPGKVFPTLSACVEQGHLHVKDGRLPFANLPRF